MKDHYDPWYVRLPDGRIVKAKSTASVRHHVQAGHIPLNSMARRHSNEEWMALNWIQEFTDLMVGSVRMPEQPSDPPVSAGRNGSLNEGAPKSGVSARLDPMRLQTVGVRGFVDELIAAFDSAVSSHKVLVTALTLIAANAITFLLVRLLGLLGLNFVGLVQGLTAAAGLGTLAMIITIMTRQTHLEISRMQPASPREAFEGSYGIAFRVFLGYLATIGVSVGLLWLFRELPGWLGSTLAGMNGTVADGLQSLMGVAALSAALLTGFVIMLAWLLAPIFVVEECSLTNALREWRALIREHRIRVLVYEGMGLGLAVFVGLPIILPVYFAFQFGPPLLIGWIGQIATSTLIMLAIAPSITFLAVANLFIYLNLRYEYTPQS